MQRKRAIGRERAVDRSTAGEPRPQRSGPRSEALHIRSYDHRRSYDLDVEVVTDDGETVFRERYYLLPGHTESETGVVPSGDCELRVTLDNRHSETLECRIDSTPDHTAVVEVGNGALALTEGLQG